MSTTTVRLPEQLKARVARAAKKAGTTAHGFILEAIAEKTEMAERRNAFQQLAETRLAEVLATGETVPWLDARRYVEQRAAEKMAARPSARKLGA
jgi:predicted transcriptional regulator